MALPAAGQPIALSDINVEIGVAANSPLALSWLVTNAKETGLDRLSSVSGKAWYKKTNDPSNCNNCTAAVGGQCGTFCVACNAACNCNNCDSVAKLQANCNCGSLCNCPYDCQVCVAANCSGDCVGCAC